MIKVIKHGNSIKYQHCECDICGCEFLYEGHDVKTEYDRVDAYNSERLYDYIKCPECSHTIKLKNYK